MRKDFKEKQIEKVRNKDKNDRIHYGYENAKPEESAVKHFRHMPDYTVQKPKTSY